MDTKKKGVRRVKGWAILSLSKQYIETCNLDVGQLYVYDIKPRWYTGNRVVPCTITYTLPTKTGKK